MKSTIKTNHKKIKYSFFRYICLVLAYLFGIFKKKNNAYLESSLKVIKKIRKNNLRKPLRFPVVNPNLKIKNELSVYGKKELNYSEFKKAKKVYLKSLSKKKQEDYAYELNKYHKWKWIYPFYWTWIKFIRLFNLDFWIHKNKAYEFSNDQLETYKQKQEKYQDWWKNIIVINWFGNYYYYLKDKIKTKKYQRNNWIWFACFTIFYLITLSIIIAYAAYAMNNKITTPPFAAIGTYPNFFIDKLPLASATLGLAVSALIFMLVPIMILISLWLSNINDASYNIFYVYSQQLIYVIVGIFLVCSTCMELSLYFAH